MYRRCRDITDTLRDPNSIDLKNNSDYANIWITRKKCIGFGQFDQAICSDYAIRRITRSWLDDYVISTIPMQLSTGSEKNLLENDVFLMAACSSPVLFSLE